MQTQTITILGLGRLGTSAGLALRASSLDVTLVGYEDNRHFAQQAKAILQAVDKLESNLIKAVSDADIVIFTMPTSRLESVLQAIGNELQEHTLFVDLSEMKRLGLDLATKYLQQGHYVGAVVVPSAAFLEDGRSDNKYASAEYFRNGTFCLMPSSTVDEQAVITAEKLGRLLGAVPFSIDLDEYDTLVQGVTTLPTLGAAAMFKAIQQTPGWRDVQRFAGLDFAASTAPLKLNEDAVLQVQHNKEATLRWLDAFLVELQQLRRRIVEDDAELLAAYLTTVDNERETWLAVRAQNNWDERNAPDIDTPSRLGKLFGGLAGSLKKDAHE